MFEDAYFKDIMLQCRNCRTETLHSVEFTDNGAEWKTCHECRHEEEINEIERMKIEEEITPFYD